MIAADKIERIPRLTFPVLRALVNRLVLAPRTTACWSCHMPDVPLGCIHGRAMCEIFLAAIQIGYGR